MLQVILGDGRERMSSQGRGRGVPCERNVTEAGGEGGNRGAWGNLRGRLEGTIGGRWGKMGKMRENRGLGGGGTTALVPIQP